MKRSPTEMTMTNEDEDKTKVHLAFGIFALLILALGLLIGNITHMFFNFSRFVCNALSFVVIPFVVVMAAFSLLAFEAEIVKKEINTKKALVAFGTATLLLFWFWFGFWFFVRLLTAAIAAPSLVAFSNMMYSKAREKTNFNEDIIAIGIVGIDAVLLLWFLFV